MRFVWGLAVVSALLVGCDSADQQAANTANAAVVASQEAGRVIVRLNDGTGLSFDGKLVKSVLRPNAEGQVRMNEIDIVGDRAAVEKAVSKILSDAGFKEKVAAQGDGLKKIHYSKKNTPVVGGLYKDREVDGKKGVRLAIYWQEA